MAGWFPPRVRNWQKINRVKLERDLKSGKRCHTCFCKIGYKLGKKNRSFEPRRVTIMKSNFGSIHTYLYVTYLEQQKKNKKIA